MFLQRAVALDIGIENFERGMIDVGRYTIIHETAHLLEGLMRLDVSRKLWEQGYVAHLSNFTHDAVGTFAEAMKYVAEVWLANYGKIVSDREDINSRLEQRNIRDTEI